MKSVGTNRLIKKGAKLVTTVKDIIKDFPYLKKVETNIEKTIYKPCKKEYEPIYKIISDTPIHIDTIIRQSNKETNEVNYILTMLELEGLIKRLSGGEFIIG